MGAPGGGGGGGGGYGWSTDAACWIYPHLKSGERGVGGKPGLAGSWGGSGGSGQNGGSTRLINLLLEGDGTSEAEPSGGSAGSAGQGKGSAIAMFGFGSGSSLNLDQVNFFDSEQTESDSFIWADNRNSKIGGTGSNIKVSVNEVYYGKNLENRINVKSGLYPRFFNGSVKTYKFANTAPAFTGISVPRVPSVADVSDTVLRGTDFSDHFNVVFEDRSTVAGITSNLTNPNNPMNRIWRQLVPDETDKIKSDFQSKANTSWEEAIFTEDFKKDVGFSVMEDGIASSINAVTAPINPTGVGGGAAGMIASDFAKAHLDYVEERVTMLDVRNTKLKENEVAQKKMQDELRKSSQASLSTVKLDLERTRVKVEDFELGEDIVTFPVSGDAGVKLNLSRVKDDKVISFQYDTGSNKDLPFLEVELTDSSVDALGMQTMLHL